MGAIGGGGDAELYLTYSPEAGKVLFRVKGKLVLGLGLGGELVGSVAVKNNWEFITFVYHQLNNNDFSYLEFMDEASYLACAGVVLMILEGAGDAISFTKDVITQSTLYQSGLNYYKRRTQYQIEVKKLAANINAKPDILKFALPEAQGAMLFKLTESFWFSIEKGIVFDREEEQEDAILVLLRNIQTKKEFRKVIERMTVDGSKGNFHSNIYRLTGLLDGSQFKAYLKHRGELAYLLQESNYPALPAGMQPIRQRVAYV